MNEARAGLSSGRGARSPTGMLAVLAIVLVATTIGPSVPYADAASVGLPVTGSITGVHDPMLVKDGATYRLFSTGGGIQMRSSPDLLTWTHTGEVFPGGLPSWMATEVPGATDLWAPDVSYWGGTWHLYYAVAIFGTVESATGHATNPTLDPTDPAYLWTDHGPVVTAHAPTAEWSSIDPNLVLDGNGTPWLAWGSFWGGIKLQELDPTSGAPAAGTPVHTIALRDPWWAGVEAAFIVPRGGYWYLFTSWYFCCQGANSNYEIHVSRAAELTGPYVDAAGVDAVANGGTLVLRGEGAMRGPGHNSVLADGGQWWLVHHWYDADANGVATLGIRELAWTGDGWPYVEGAELPPTTTSVPSTTVPTSLTPVEVTPAFTG